MAEFHQIAGYEVIGTLGQGARSTIYAVRDKKGQKLALKRVVKDGPEDQRFIDQVLTEHEVAQAINHPRLRKSLKVIKQRQVIRVSEVLVLMELVLGKTLEQAQPETMLEACKAFYEAAEGLAAMHEAGYVHADIKPNNIMVTERDGVKLIDFGQSCKNGCIKERIQGTPDYIAPEQVRREAITVQTDIFNLGATFYWLLTGRHAPTLVPDKMLGESVGLKTQDHGKRIPPNQINAEIPPALSSLIMDCIEKDPADRPESMQSVRDRLEIAAAQIKRSISREPQRTAG
jgi:serine/threonine-protein kinase